MASVWPVGGGAVGALMRERDWADSPLGPPEAWPPALRSVAGLMLNSKIPMFVAWGPELGLLYNDAYAEVLGAKHPRALGARFQAVWGEIWPDIAPLIDAATRGEAIYREDLPLVMNRYGYDEQTWFTFSYSPVEDEGRIAGMFCACVETTARVREVERRAFLAALDERLRDLDDGGEILLASAALLREQLGADRVHWAEIDAPTDTFEVRYEQTSPGAPPFLGAHRLSDFGETVIARMGAGELIALDDVVAAAPSAPRPALPLGAAISIPLLRAGVWTAALCAHMLGPRRWREDERQLIREVAERAWTRAERANAETRVRHSEERFRALVGAVSDITFRLSRDWAQVYEINGAGLQAPESTDLSALLAWLPASEADRVRAAINEAVATGKPFELEHRAHLSTGDGWLRAWAVPLRDGRGEIVEWFGAASDVTAARKARQELEENAERLRLATEAAEVGFWDLDLVTEVLIWPPRVKQMFGIADDAPVSMADFYAGLHPEDHDRVAAAFQAALDPVRRAIYDVEYRTVGKEDGRVRWVAAKGRGVFTPDGQCVRVIGTAIDITVRKAAEEHMRLMVNELNHRVKNSLATVQAITAQTLRRGVAPDEVREALTSRLLALAEAHDVLTDEKWSGAELAELAAQAAAPYGDVNGGAPFEIDGPRVFLPPKTAIAMALAFHELATNAAKYGALSTPGGVVRIGWRLSRSGAGRLLQLLWEERGGPQVRPPERTGFGTRLIQRGLASELGGKVQVEYAPTGLVCRMTARLPEEASVGWSADLQLG